MRRVLNSNLYNRFYDIMYRARVQLSGRLKKEGGAIITSELLEFIVQCLHPTVRVPSAKKCDAVDSNHTRIDQANLMEYVRTRVNGAYASINSAIANMI